jgi:hypothetical protein
MLYEQKFSTNGLSKDVSKVKFSSVTVKNNLVLCVPVFLKDEKEILVQGNKVKILR